MTYYYHGFFYETEEELRSQLSIDEYLDYKFEKCNQEWEQETWWNVSEDEDENEDDFNFSWNTYMMRQVECLTQKEFAQVLGISVRTLSRIEKGHGNISKKVKMKIKNYFDEQ